MLNAALAVIRLRKWLEFYGSEVAEYHSLFIVQTGSIIKGVML